MTIECDKCGACCLIGPGITLANDPQVPAKYRDSNNCLKSNGSRCAALQGAVGISARCELVSQTEDLRPRICIDYQIGGSNCLEDRRRVTVRGQSPHSLITPEEQALIDSNPIEIVKA